MSIEEDANQDLAVSDEDAEGVAGGQKAGHKPHTSGPLYIDQKTTFGGTEVSANSGDDDCAPENAGSE